MPSYLGNALELRGYHANSIMPPAGGGTRVTGMLRGFVFDFQ